MLKRLLLLVILIPSFLTVHSQEQTTNRTGLFIHTDKSIYLKNETIWFGAYLFVTNTKEESLHNILNVVIATAASGKVILEERYPIQRGLSIGQVLLPDSIKNGVYHLIGYSNVFDAANKPIAKFISTITIGQSFNQNAIAPSPLIKSNSNKSLIAKITTDKSIYGKREMAKVKVQLEDENHHPVQGIISIAAVHHSRINQNLKKINSDISYTNHDTSLVEQKNIVKVSYKNKSLKKPASIAMMANGGLKLITTNNEGLVEIDNESMLIPVGKKVTMKVTGQNASDFTISLQDPFGSTANDIAKANITLVDTLAHKNQFTPVDNITITEKTLELNTVTIKGSNNSSKGEKLEPGINDCGDWVDEYDYLNYPYSQKRFKPIIGKLYKKRIDIDEFKRSFKVEPITYTGCSTTKQETTLFKGINLPIQFYGLDKTSNNLQFLTTLFWNAGLLTNTNGEAEFSFSTTDLSGEYKIILQGITASSTIYGEVDILVKP